MSADGPATSPDDPRVEEAVKTWVIAPRLTVMLAVGFIPSDAAGRNKLEASLDTRRAPSKQDRMAKPSDVALLSPGSTVSSTTTTRSEEDYDVVAPRIVNTSYRT